MSKENLKSCHTRRVFFFCVFLFTLKQVSLLNSHSVDWFHFKTTSYASRESLLSIIIIIEINQCCIRTCRTFRAGFRGLEGLWQQRSGACYTNIFLIKWTILFHSSFFKNNNEYIFFIFKNNIIIFLQRGPGAVAPNDPLNPPWEHYEYWSY